MGIKKYYCPDCDKFKNRWQVKALTFEHIYATWITGYMCKECGCKNVKKTETELKKLFKD